MIPGKKYLPEDYLQAAWRRRWYIVLPLLIVSVGTFVGVRMLPDQYRSEALLLIVPPQVPENYVKATIRTPVDERVQALGQELLTRSRLESIVRDFDLYPKERKTMLMDDVIDLMRQRDVAFSTPRVRRSDADAGSFTVSFQYTNPRTAMLVTEKLASLFVLENIENRTGLTEQTDKFLQTQLDDTRRQLVDYEKKIEQLRRSRPGMMPGQEDANQQALASAQIQLQGLQESINRDRERQLMLQRQVATLSQAPAPAVPADEANAPKTAAEQLAAAQAAMKQLRLRLTEDHPDIKRLERTIQNLQRQVADEALHQPVSPVDPSDAARAAQLGDLKVENEMLERRLTQKLAQEKQLLETMDVYRRRLEAAPAVETEFTQVMRDYTTLQNVYQSLLTKRQDAKVSASVERGQIGEQFKIIDPPRMAVLPFSPNRLRLNLMGVATGLAIGLLLAGLLEYRDTSLRTESDVMVALSLPVVALVPTIMTIADGEKRKRRALLVASSGLTVVLVVAVVLVWKLRLLS